MATVTESDIQELKALIVSFQQDVSTRLTALEIGQKQLETRMSALETGQKELDAGQRQLETRFTVIETRLDTWKPAMDKIPDLAEKVGEVKKWRTRYRRLPSTL